MHTRYESDTHPDPWIYHTNLLSLGHLGHEHQAHGLGTLSFILGFLEPLPFSLLDSFPGGWDISREVFLDDFNDAPVETAGICDRVSPQVGELLACSVREARLCEDVSMKIRRSPQIQCADGAPSSDELHPCEPGTPAVSQPQVFLHPKLGRGSKLSPACKWGSNDIHTCELETPAVRSRPTDLGPRSTPSSREKPNENGGLA
jgi:hypothetical protein